MIRGCTCLSFFKEREKIKQPELKIPEHIIKTEDEKCRSCDPQTYVSEIQKMCPYWFW